MVERREDTPSVPSSGEAVATRLRRVARKARTIPREGPCEEPCALIAQARF